MTDKFRGLDDIFGTIPEPSGENIARLKLVDLDFHPQRTSMYSEEDLQTFAEDIAEYGVLEPILVRKMPPDDVHLGNIWYQVLNGRNRVASSRLAGVEDVPALIVDADDNIAAYIVATTTLNQRQQLLPSEKAFAFQMQLEAMKRKAGRPSQKNPRQLVGDFNYDEKNSRQLVGDFESADLVSKNESGRTVQRYICLTRLISSLLQLVDNGTLSLGAGVSLSYLSPNEQETLDAFLQEHKIMISLEQAEHLKQYSQNMGAVSYQQLRNMFSPERPQKVVARDMASIRFKKPVLKQVWSYIPEDVDEGDVPDYILRALEFYKNNVN